MDSNLTLKAYYQLCKQTIQDGKDPMVFVVGNESCDMDSFTSALIYARLHSTPDWMFIPFVNIPRADLALRPEFAHVLEFCGTDNNGVTFDNLLTLDDLPLPNDQSGTKTDLVLVDHNLPTGAFAKLLGDKVIAIVDHHKDEGNYLHIAPRLITTAGSCTSLVANEYKNDVKRLGPGLAKLALASVLIDTRNLQEKAKVTKYDEKAISLLETVAGSGFNRNTFYEDLMHVYESIESMSIYDCLRKDYKQWTIPNGLVLGTSVVQKPMIDVLDKALQSLRDQYPSVAVADGHDFKKGGKDIALSALQSVVLQFAKDKNLDLLSVQTSYQDPAAKEDAAAAAAGAGEEIEIPIRREMFNIAFSFHGYEASKAFEDQYATKLSLKKWSDGRMDKKHDYALGKTSEKIIYDQRCFSSDGNYSRKLTAPILQEVLGKVDLN